MDLMVFSQCEANTNIETLSIVSCSRSIDFFLKLSSPTLKYSSITIISDVFEVKTENIKRIIMPEEYVLTGKERNAPSAENSAILSINAWESLSEIF